MKKKVLFVYGSPYYYGGGAHLSAHALEAVCRKYEVFCLTPGKPDFSKVDSFFGTCLIEVSMTLRSTIDEGVWGWLLKHFAGRWMKMSIMERIVRNIHARSPFDAYVSTVDEFAFPVRGLQYVHYPRLKHFYAPHSYSTLFTRLGLARLYKGLCKTVGGESTEIFSRNVTLANSEFTADAVRALLETDLHVVYPPIFAGPSTLAWEQRADRFLYVGRICEEKRIPLIIEILKMVRDRGHDIQLTIAGTWDSSEPYVSELKTHIENNRNWVDMAIGLQQGDLADLMNVCRYGIHAMEREHFGMAPAEIQNSGAIVFAHNSGGPREILDFDDRLLYDSEDDAVEKIHKILSDIEYRKSVLKDVSTRRGRFSVEKFKSSFIEQVDRLVLNEV